MNTYVQSDPLSLARRVEIDSTPFRNSTSSGATHSRTKRRNTGIIHVPVRFAANRWGGAETVMMEVCHEQQRAGWNPQIITSKVLAPKPVEDLANVPIRRFDYCYPFFGLNREEKDALDRKGGNPLSMRLFTALLREPDVRLFHTYSLKRVGGMARTAARIRKKPLVVTLLEGLLEAPEAERKALDAPVPGKLEWGSLFSPLFGARRILEDADMVICGSASECAQARQVLTHERIAHLPRGVDCQRFAHGDGPGFRKQHGIPQNAYLVMNISSVHQQKNQLLLLEAFAKVAQENPAAYLVILGPETDPAYGVLLRKIVRENQLESRVSFLPALRHDDPALVDAYHACDVFVLPSLHEAFGIVVLEAWSAGKAVIVSSANSLQNLVARGKTGLIFDAKKKSADDVLAAKLSILAQSPNLRHFLGENGRQEVEKRYTWRKLEADLETLYQLAEGNAARRFGKSAK